MVNKHILHIAFGLDIGGLERVLINTINGLPHHKHSIIVLTKYSEKFLSLLPEHVEVIALGKQAGHSWSLYLEMYSKIKGLKPDVVHSYNLATLEYQTCAFFAGVKTRIHAEHGRDMVDPYGNNKKYQWLRRLISPFVHSFVSVSNDLHSWLQDTVKLPNSKTKLIYNGVDTKHFIPGDKIQLDDQQQQKFVFGCVGRLASIKDHKMLLNAFEHACSIDESFSTACQLTLVGGGEKMEALTAQKASLQHGDKMLLAGEHFDMKNVYQSFDVFTLSSLAEGIPMTALEAMACAKPVLSTQVGGLPEVVADGIEGMLVDSHDPSIFAKKMIEMYHNQSLQQMAESARALAEQKFSEQTMLAGYETLYTQGT